MLQQYQQTIEQYRHKVYSFAYYSLRAREDAEDVTQEVFIKLWQHWRKIDQEKLGAWLMRVARNAIVDHIRKQKPSKDHDDQFSDVQEQGQHVDVAGQLDQAVFQKELLQAIRSLEEPFRSIVIMRDIQGQSYADIQESLEMSASQVKVYLHRGRRKLRSNARLREMFSATTGTQLGSSIEFADTASHSE